MVVVSESNALLSLLFLRFCQKIQYNLQPVDSDNFRNTRPVKTSSHSTRIILQVDGKDYSPACKRVT